MNIILYNNRTSGCGFAVHKNRMTGTVSCQMCGVFIVTERNSIISTRQNTTDWLQ